MKKSEFEKIYMEKFSEATDIAFSDKRFHEDASDDLITEEKAAEIDGHVKSLIDGLYDVYKKGKKAVK